MAAPRHSRPRSSSDRNPRAGGGGRQWLTGIHAVQEALRARRREFHRLAVREGVLRAELQELAEDAKSLGIEVAPVSTEFLQNCAEGDANHQGIALEAGPIPEFDLRGLLAQKSAVPAASRRFVALDGVEDPQNVGALARVADSAGVDGLILTNRRSPPLTPSLARASAGAIEWLPVARVPNLGRALKDLQAEGFWVVATDADAPSSLFEMEDRLLTGRLVVVLGAEGKGIRPSILEQSDHRVAIPMRGRVASLNVSTAAAVLLYDLLRREGAQPAVDEPD